MTDPGAFKKTGVGERARLDICAKGRRTMAKVFTNAELCRAVAARLSMAVGLCLIVVAMGCDGADGSVSVGLPDLDTLLSLSGQADIVTPGEHVDSVLLAGPDIGHVWFRHLAPGWSTTWLGEGKHVGGIYVFSPEGSECLKAIPVDAHSSVYAPTAYRMGRDVFILSYIFAPNGEPAERGLSPYELQVHRATPQTSELVFSKAFTFLEYKDGQDLPGQVFFILISDILERTVLLEVAGVAGRASPFALSSRTAYIWDEKMNTFTKSN